MAAGVTDRLWEICDIVNILKVLGSPHGELTMRDMMDGGGMMWGMGIGWLIAAVVAVLLIGALVKYVFFR